MTGPLPCNPWTCLIGGGHPTEGPLYVQRSLARPGTIQRTQHPMKTDSCSEPGKPHLWIVTVDVYHRAAVDFGQVAHIL